MIKEKTRHTHTHTHTHTHIYIYIYMHIVFVTIFLIFKFILIYLLHVLFVLKIEGIFENRKSQSKRVESSFFFIYSIDYTLKQIFLH